MIEFQYAQIYEPLLTSKARFNVLYGGRDSGKSTTIAQLLLDIVMSEKKRILCTRELQNSMKESVHKLLTDIIDSHQLPGFKITRDNIRHKNGSEFIFKGLKSNINELKSLQGIDLCWVEEAQNISETSWKFLINTIREDGSQIFVSFNPLNETDPTYERFITNTQPDSLVIKANFYDNPWKSKVLDAQREFDKANNYDDYLWVWEGFCKKISQAQVFAGKFVVQKFITPDNADFFYGADWGFSTDPTTLIRSFIVTDEGVERILCIDQELYGVNIETINLPKFFNQMPDADKYVIRADSARPEIISHMQKNGFSKLIAAKKWKGSVEDGISYLKGFDKIIIHERCVNTIEEFKNYSYKTNKLTGDISAILEDKHNHCIDALRYAHEPLISKPPEPRIRFISYL